MHRATDGFGLNSNALISKVLRAVAGLHTCNGRLDLRGCCTAQLLHCRCTSTLSDTQPALDFLYIRI